MLAGNAPLDAKGQRIERAADDQFLGGRFAGAGSRCLLPAFAGRAFWNRNSVSGASCQLAGRFACRRQALSPETPTFILTSLFPPDRRTGHNSPQTEPEFDRKIPESPDMRKDMRFRGLLRLWSRCSTFMKGSTRVIFGIAPVSGWVM